MDTTGGSSRRNWDRGAGGGTRVRWRWRVAALVAGALPALAFPAVDLWLFGFVGLVPLLWLTVNAPGPREVMWRGWLGGVGFMAATHQWLVPATGLFTIPAAGLLGTLWIPWTLAAHHLLRSATPRTSLAAVAVVPSAFVLGEYVRSWDLLGGPWGLLGATQWNNRPVLALAAVGGVWLVSGVIVATNVVLYAVVRHRGSSAVRAMAAVLTGVLAATVFTAGIRSSPEQSAGAMQIGGVQAGVVHDEAERFARHEALSADLVGADLDLVVWAESSVGFDLQRHPEYLARLQALARQLGAPLLVNVDARHGDAGGIAKAAVMIGPEGVMGRYDKMRLVPFGEYIPLRPALGWIAAVSDAAAEDRVRGERPTVMPVAAWQVGPLICFESAFPDLPRVLAEQGADVVVVQTATTTFQGSWAQPQHASLAALRAVESGRTVVHAAVSGVTAVFDPSGERLLEMDDAMTGAWSALAPIAGGTTPYVRYGDWVPALAMAVSLAALASAAVRRARDVHDAAAGAGHRGSRSRGGPGRGDSAVGRSLALRSSREMWGD